ncbi:MAG: hypothetical protein MMC23_008624 [Stictis urceolatum]|nr:hypothetical protein [Stictis urceolata]
MDERAAIPVSLPKPNPTTSYWQDPPASLSNHRTTTDLPKTASIVIIGSGITGASLALNLLSQDHGSSLSVVMLEARTACNGATGRNGGHTKCASYRSFLDNKRALGEDEAARIVRFEYLCMKAVHSFAREHNIACDSWEGDTVDVIYDEKQWLLAGEAVSAIQQALGSEDPASKYRFWASEEAATKFLTPGSCGAVSYEAGSLSAYKFVIGLLDLCIEKGLNLQTETPATEVHKMDGGWVVHTPRGNIHAERVVLATNGYTAHLYPDLQGAIVPLRGHVAAHRPGSKMPAQGLETTYSFIYSDGYEYMIPRPIGSAYQGDIVIGGGLTKASEEGLKEFGTIDDATVDTEIIQYLRQSTAIYFQGNWGEDDADGRVRKEWTGIMGYSPDGFPLVGEIPNQKGLMIAASFQGHGMVLAFLTAKALALMMAGKDDTELNQWFPNRAFRITSDRLTKKFKGRLHTNAPDIELKSQ